LCDAGYVAVASIANIPNPGWKKSGRPNGVKKLFFRQNLRVFPPFLLFEITNFKHIFSVLRIRTLDPGSQTHTIF
jgi:hypothetical protein